MFYIQLYTVAKRPNSTKLPSAGTGVSFQCVCRDESSIINPIIELQGDVADIRKYNYAYISDWRRYYRISDIVAGLGRIVQLYLQIDVLASYRSQILGSSQYVVRSASAYNGDIVDHYYATRNETSYDSAALKITYGGIDYDVMNLISNTYITNYFSRSISQGDFIIGVIGDNDTGISYYALNYSNFKTLLGNLMSYAPSDMNDVSSGIAKVLADPMQYITTCFWVPYAGQVTQTARTIKFGYYSISCTAGVLNASDYAHFRTYADLPKHPQASSRGSYLNTFPYTSYTLELNPFGSLQLDTVKLASASKIRIEWYYDCTKGNGELFVRNDGTGEIAYHGYADMLGVPIQLSQLTVNTIQTGTSIMDAIGSAFRFDIGGIFSSIGNAVESQQPKVTRRGSEGSFLNYHVTPGLIADFTRIVDEDLANIGRPYCQKATLSSLSGYAECGNPSVEISGALAKESEMIENFLRDGFFIE